MLRRFKYRRLTEQPPPSAIDEPAPPSAQVYEPLPDSGLNACVKEPSSIDEEKTIEETPFKASFFSGLPRHESPASMQLSPATEKTTESPPVHPPSAAVPLPPEVEDVRLNVFHSLIRLCGEARLMRPDEALAVIRSHRLPAGEMLLAVVESLVNTQIDTIQERLLAREKRSIISAGAFQQAPRLAQIEALQTALRPLGIRPIAMRQTLVSCLMSFPDETEITLAMARRLGLPFRWCHPIICRASELREHVD
ncbi:MAG: hypothetical protein PHV34_18180 [Verrucomicrobiae bacterium]|nr:hypothetical protein [Verrucomicrobiae bacterium]